MKARYGRKTRDTPEGYTPEGFCDARTKPRPPVFLVVAQPGGGGRVSDRRRPYPSAGSLAVGWWLVTLPCNWSPSRAERHRVETQQLAHSIWMRHCCTVPAPIDVPDHIAVRSTSRIWAEEGSFLQSCWQKGPEGKERETPRIQSISGMFPLSSCIFLHALIAFLSNEDIKPGRTLVSSIFTTGTFSLCRSLSVSL